MRIWNAIRRFSGIGKRIRADHAVHRASKRQTPTLRSLINRGLRMEQFEERVLLSINPSNLSELWEANADLARSIERAANLDGYSAEELATATQWVVGLSTPDESSSFHALAANADFLGEASYLPNAAIWEFDSNLDWNTVVDTLECDGSIDYYYPLIYRQYELMSVPNDTLFGDQWHLQNTGQNGGTVGADVNVVAAWDSVLGTDVVIGIADSGLQYTHPDLATNYRADLSWDFGQDDADPSHEPGDSPHGTSVAGVSGGTGDNGIGISGAAPDADLVGLRLDFNSGWTDYKESLLFSHENQEIDIYNNSWGPSGAITGLGPLAEAAIENGVNYGRDGLGNIYVFSAGNGRLDYDNTSYDSYRTSRYTIAVAAIDHNGEYSYYSSPGASVFVSGYSNSVYSGITTTDMLGEEGYNQTGTADDDPLTDIDYTSTFGGTSSAAPLVSGVIALILEANPNLTYRDVQHILAETSTMNDADNPSWSINGAGYHVSNDYGFGAVNADAAVSLAFQWENVSAEKSTSSGIIDVNQTIPDGTNAGLTQKVTMDDSIDNIEWVELIFDADHYSPNELEVSLISPDGTVSQLTEANGAWWLGGSFDNWSMTSCHHWGESSEGEWTIQVKDRLGGTVGTWNHFELNIYGTIEDDTPIEPPEPGTTSAGLELIDVIPNSGTAITENSTQNVAPRELTLVFNEGQEIDPATIGAISLQRAGGDDIFLNLNDESVEFGYIGIGDQANEIVIRFAETLPDDRYQLTILGTGDSPLATIGGSIFHEGEDFTINFNLDLGAQVTAVVPQPTERLADGTISQSRNTIEVYFNEELDPAFAEIPEFYSVIYTNETADAKDDLVCHPSEVTYDPATNKATLKFKTSDPVPEPLDIAELFPDPNNPGEFLTGAFRLRIGNEYGYDTNNDGVEDTFGIQTLDSYDQELVADIFDEAHPITGLIGVSKGTSVTVSSIIEPKPYDITYSGGADEQGSRDLPTASGDDENHYLTTADSEYGISKIYYNFNENLGNGYYNQITEIQKQRAREIFELYSTYLGIDFIEDTSEEGQGLTVATGDLRAIDPTLAYTGTDLYVGLADYSSGLAVMDMAETWNNEYNGSWFNTAMHEIGHLLGLGNTYDLPDYSVMGNVGPTGEEYYAASAETMYPGIVDAIHGQYLHRTDSIDVDVYTFTLDTNGTISAEIIAERLDDSSLLDSVITIYDADHNMIARNDDYYSEDSFLELTLTAGTYYVAVSSTGNTEFDPEVPGSGQGGTSQGEYDLRLTFIPKQIAGEDNTNAPEHMVDATGTMFDGDADGVQGGVYNFWFDVQTEANTIFVDKAATDYTGTGDLGSITNPYTEIDQALAAANAGQIVRIVGNREQDFNIQKTVNTLDAPEDAAVGDFNNDGIPDLVAIAQDNKGDFFAQVYYGINGESYWSPISYEVGLNPSDIKVADLDNDGAEDIVVTNSGDATVSLLMNNGDGSFADHATRFTGNNPVAVELGDLNGDGRVDMVIANEADDTIGVLLSNDVSFFADQVAYSVRNDGDTNDVQPIAITLGDVNDDGMADIISINQNGSITILVNQGANQTTGETTFEKYGDNLIIGGTLSAGILADFNEDGTNDLALVDAENDRIVIRLGKYDPNSNNIDFEVPDFRNVGDNPTDIGVGDSDGDGHLDLFVLNQDSGTVSIFFGVGDGSFGDELERSVGDNPSGMTIADTDRNGRPDIVVSNKEDNTISVLTATRDRAYEIGSDIYGNTLEDGRYMAIPQDVSVMIDAGAMFKLRAANIDVGSSSQGIDRSEGSLQVLGTPDTSVYFTSYYDRTMGVDTAISTDEATPGDWGGLVFRNDIDYDDGRTVLESEGIFLNYVNNAEFYYGGGQVTVNSVRSVYTPIHMTESRPTIAFNDIYFSADAAISADVNSFADNSFQGEDYTNDYNRVGPDIHGNIVTDNTLNGLYVRINTAAGSVLENLETAARFDDTDIVHILGENLIIGSTPGGPTLAEDGTYEARTDARLSIDPGIVIKLDQARIETEIGAQLIAEGTSELPIIFTSYLDNRYGIGGTFDTTSTSGNYDPEPGNWSGLYFGPISTASLDNTVIAYGGGTSRIEGGFAEFNVVESHQATLRLTNSELEFNNGVTTDSNRVGRESTEAAVIYVKGAQPVLVNNTIINNNAPAININANSLIDDQVADWGRSTGQIDNFEAYDDNSGPLVRGNLLYNNAINGMVVRGEVLSTASVWDDTDIVHVLTSEIVTTNYYSEGGLRLESAADESLVVKLYGDDAGFTALGTPSEIDDRIGGTLQIVGMAGFPVILTSLRDDSVGAGVDPWGNFVFDTDNADLEASSGDWRSVKLEEYVNDRNVAIVNEVELSYGLGIDALADKLATTNASGLKELLNDLEDISAGFVDNMIESLITEADLESDDANALRGESTNQKVNILVYGHGTVIDLSNYEFDGLVYASVADLKGILEGLDSNFSDLLMDAVHIGTNDTALNAQYLGLLAPDQQSGDDNLRLGYDIQGFIRTDDTNDADVYAFNGTAGTEVWFDIDSTTLGLNAVVELIDADGNVLARSVNSAQEDLGLIEREGIARSMDRDIWNTNDQYTTSLNDAGMRVVLPGAEGETLTYYVRVSSYNEDGDVLNTGDSRGAYQLQIRLQEEQEIAGSTVQKTSIRYASTGIELVGLPSNSPLTVDAAETDNQNNTFQTAQDLGNLLISDLGQLTVAGNIDSRYDIDWYSFSIQLDGIEDIEGVPVNEIQWPTIFDIDYADGLSRPDLVLYVFDSSGTLVYYGDDSNVSDDIASMTMDDLLAGSFGTADPFIGPVNLLEGVDNQYYVAVANRAMVPEVLSNAETRVEPINSVTRVSEDQIANSGESLVASSPFTSILPDDTGVNAQDIELNLHVDDYTLNDVVLYITSGDEVYTVNPYTGQVETDITGVYDSTYTLTGNTYGDLAMRDDGRLFSLSLGNTNPSTIGTYTEFSTEDGDDIYTHDDGIAIYRDVDGEATEITYSGIRFQAMAYLPTGVSQALGLGSGGYIAVGSGGGGAFTENLLFFFDENGNAVNPIGYDDPGDILPSNAIPWNQLVEKETVTTTAATRTNGSDIHDGDTVTLDIVDETYEYDLGVVATLSDLPEDGDSFSINGTTFEFEKETYIQINNLGSTAFVDNTSFTLIDDATTRVVFEIDRNGSGATIAGAVNIDLTGLNDAALIGQTIATAINDSDLSIVATYVQSTDQIILENCSGYIDASLGGTTSIDLIGGGGVTQGNLAVKFNETMSLSDVLQQVVAVATAQNGGNMDANTADNRIAFPDALTCDFTNAPTMSHEGALGALSDLPSEGDTFDVGNATFEFDLETYIQLHDLSTTNIVDNTYFTLIDEEGTQAIFELNTDGSTATIGGAIAVDLSGVTDIASLGEALTNAINDSGLELTATFDQALEQIILNGCEGHIIDQIGATDSIELLGGDDVDPGNLRIRFNPLMTTEDVLQQVVSVATDNNIDAHAVGNQITFPDVLEDDCNFDDTPNLTLVGGSMVGVSGLNNTVRIRLDDSASQVASKLAAAIKADLNGHGITASSAGDTVTVQFTNPAAITGLTFIDGELYACNADGSFFNIENYTSVGFRLPGDDETPDGVAEQIIPITNSLEIERINIFNDVSFTGLDQGPVNAESSIYANILFATGTDLLTGEVILFAFDTEGNQAPIFANGQSSIAIQAPENRSYLEISGTTGLAFSTLDYNLWHVTTNRGDGDTGHGTTIAPDGTRTSPFYPMVDGNASFWFGYEEGMYPNYSEYSGALGGALSNTDVLSTYDLPGGAHGSLTTNTFSLAGYSADDLPLLTFNYFLETDANSNEIPADAATDTARVFISDDGVTWQLLASNTENTSVEIDDAPVPEPAYDVVHMTDGSGIWNQCVIDLSDMIANLTDLSNLRLKFEFTTAGSTASGDQDYNDLFENIDLQIVAGDQIVDGDFIVVANDPADPAPPEFTYSMGYSMVLANSAGQAITDGDTFTIDGHTFEFDKDGANSDDGTDPNYHVISITDDDATFALADKLENILNDVFSDRINLTNIDTEYFAYTVDDRIYLPLASEASATSTGLTMVEPANAGAGALAAAIAAMDASELEAHLTALNTANPGFIDNVTDAVIEWASAETGISASIIEFYIDWNYPSDSDKIDLIVNGGTVSGNTLPGLVDMSESDIETVLSNLDSATYDLIEAEFLPGGGTTATDTTIVIKPWMTSEEVAVRTAEVINNYFTQEDYVTDVIDYDQNDFYTTLKLDGDLISFSQYVIMWAGPHSTSYSPQPGDDPFEASANAASSEGTHYYSDLRGKDNAYEGFYIDDVVIGFAERGMMVTDAEEGNTNFVQVDDSDLECPFDYDQNPIYTGEYQLTIRSGSEYTTGTPFRSLDTNDRNTQAITLLASAAGDIANYDSFTINDGVKTQTFQFVDGSLPADNDKLIDGAILIPYEQGQSAQEIAYYICEAINDAGTTDITASVITGLRSWESGSNRIDLFNAASVDGIEYLFFGDENDNLYPVSENATFVTYADVTGDNMEDIITINSEENTVRIFHYELNEAIKEQLIEMLASAGMLPSGPLDIRAALEILEEYDIAVPASYIHEETIYVGSSASDIAVRDISGDGLPDLLVSNYGDDTISIAINSGAGYFNQPFTINTGNAPSSIEVEDLNGDGIYDLIVTCEDDNAVEIHLGNGDLTFSDPTSILVGVAPKEFVVGDLNNDTNLDIVTVNSGDNSVSVLLGNGDGTFQAPTSTTVGRMPVGIAIGDLNQDDIPDIATANRGDNTISILLNDGSGVLTPAEVPTYATGSDPVDIQIADITGDGINDIGTINYGDSTITNYMGAEEPEDDVLFVDEGNWNIGTFATNGGPTSFVYGSVSGNFTINNTQEMLISDATGQFISLFTLTMAGPVCTVPPIIYDIEQESINLNQLTGDTNNVPEQGYIIIAANEVLYSSKYGISSDAGVVNDTAVPGAVASYGEENTEQLVPGISIKNNLIVDAGNAGIFFSGSPDATENGNDTAIPFGRILNNTIYGCTTGILVTENASPTLLNNIVSTNRTGISIDDTCQTTVIGGTVYHENTNNVTGLSYGDLGNFAIVLGADDPLFVDAENNNFYLAENSKAIDSAIDSLEERDTLAEVTEPLGIAESPILAPEYDLYGQQRSDDPSMDTPPGMGMSLFKDRGAIDRIDFTAPTSSLIDPMDNDDAGLDRNSDENDVFIAYERVSVFGIQLTDPVGAGIDDNTVVSSAVKIYKNGSSQPLTAGQDYFFRYDSGTNVIRLYPSSGLWDTGSTYTIVLDNSDSGIADIAGNPVRANRYDGTTVFNVSIANFDYGDAPEDANNDKLNYPTLLNNTTDTTEGGARHLQIGDYYLGNSVTGEDDANLVYDEDTGELITDAKGDAGDDGVAFSDSALMIGETVEIVVTASRNGGYLNAWIDFNDDGDWDDPGEKLTFSIDIDGDGMPDDSTKTETMLLEEGENHLWFTVPDGINANDTYARFRYSSEQYLDVNGEAPDGEVEDYQVHLAEDLLDYGDAPETINNTPTSYNTADTYHKTDGTLFLGSSVDSEIEGQPHPNALGDDQIGIYDSNEGVVINDEDGIEFVDYLQPGEVATIQVTVSGSGYLKGWIDFNGDGDWDDSEDLNSDGDWNDPGDWSENLIFSIDTDDDGVADTVANVMALGEGVHTLYFTVPDIANAGTTFARFRLYDDSTLTVGPTGTAIDSNTNEVTPLGEVEDYAIVITEQPRDFGDAPRSYHTQQTSEEASALLELPGNNNDILLTANIPGTDYNGIKISIVNEIAYGDDARVTFNTITNSYLIDVDPEATTAQTVIDAINAEGTFTAVRDITNDVNNDGSGLVDVDPGLIAITDGGYDGFGEEAAMHDLGSKLALGNYVDAEINGRPTDDATGDDEHGSDDEDGFDLAQVEFVAGEQTTLNFTANMGSVDTAYLNAWIDFNQDGVFSSDEQVIADTVVTETSNKQVTITLPIDALAGETYVRFRLSSEEGLDWYGMAPDGEVEDYKIEILKGDATISGYAFEDLNYNKTWDSEEPGQVGVIVYVDLNNSGSLDYIDVNSDGEFDLNIDTPTEPYAVTMDDDPSTPDEDETGYYEFSGLFGRVAAYTVRQMIPNGFLSTYPNDLVTLPDGSHGNNGDSNSANECDRGGYYSIFLEDGELLENANFGNFEKAHVTVEDVVVTEGNVGYTDIEVTVTLTHSFGADLMFTYQTADGSATANVDYLPSSGTFTFDAQSTPVANWTTTVLTTTETNDYDYLADGQFVIWEGYDGHDWEIYLFAGKYNAEDEPIIHQLTDNMTDDRNAVIHASQNINKTFDVMVAWTGYTSDGSDTEIFAYKANFNADGTLNETAGNEEQWSGPLTNNTFNDQAPQLSDTYLTWWGDDGRSNEIFYYNIEDIPFYDLEDVPANAADENYQNPIPNSLTENDYLDQAPIVQGSNIVWIGDMGRGNELFLFTGEYDEYDNPIITQITNNYTDDKAPQIDGNNIVWEGYQGSAYQIFVYQIDTGTVTQVTSTTNHNRFAQISGNDVVWQSRQGDDWEIYHYNIEAEDYPTNISSNAYQSDERPEIMNEMIVWRSFNGENYETYYHKLRTDGSISSISNPENSTGYPHITEDIAVWRSYNGTNYDIVIAKQEAPVITQTINLRVIGDMNTEIDETFFLNIQAVENSWVDFDSSQATITILNDDGDIDFGDAPESYSTLLVDNGARHLASDTFTAILGSTIDREQDARPSDNCDGDDNHQSLDEDGISIETIGQGTVATITVNVDNPDGNVCYLDGWIDFKQEGNWDGLNDKIKFLDSNGVPVDKTEVFDGENTLTFLVPNNAVAGLTNARFRLSDTGGLDYTGQVSGGEVEDYQVEIIAKPTLVGGVVTTSGTDGDDTFIFTAGHDKLEVTINNATYSFDRDQVDQILFDGGTGQDTVIFNGTEETEKVDMWTNRARFIESDNEYLVDTNNVEIVQAFSGNVKDTVVLAGLEDYTSNLGTTTGIEFVKTHLYINDLSAATIADQTYFTLTDYSNSDNDTFVFELDTKGDGPTIKDESNELLPNCIAVDLTDTTPGAVGNAIADAINGSGLNITATYDPTNDTVTLEGQKHYADNFTSTTGIEFVEAHLQVNEVSASAIDDNSSFELTDDSDPQNHVTFEIDMDGSGATIANAVVINLSEITDPKVAAQKIADAISGSSLDIAASYHQRSGDTVTMTGSMGNDTFISDPESQEAILVGDTFTLTSNGYKTVEAFGAGGNDMATFNGSEGDDTYTASPEAAQMVSAGVTATANDFRYAFAYAVEGGNDTATLNDSEDTDMFNFSANPEDLTEIQNFVGVPVTMNTMATLGNEAYELAVYNFSEVVANSSGGKDEAYMTGSPGKDTFHGRPIAFNSDTGENKNGSYAKLFSTDEVEYNCFADGFRYVTAVAVAGDNPYEDFAMLQDSQGADTLVATPTYAKMSGTGYYYRADDFPMVEATSNSGEDVAMLFDSSEDDLFDTFGATGRIDYGGVGSRHYVSANNFKHLTAIGGSGGNDVAKLYGTSANDVFIATEEYAKMRRQGNDSYYRVESFQTVEAYGGGGEDVAYLYDSIYDDKLTASGSKDGEDTYVKMEYLEYDFLREIRDFEEVHSESRSSGDKKKVEESVDFLFTEGIWIDEPWNDFDD